MDIYLALIEGTATPDDFRLSVRVLPNMRNLLDISTLPRFPYFFGNKAYTGKIGELVWIISNTEFTMGYILGLVSKYDWDGSYADQSILLENFEKIRNVYVELRGVVLPFSDLEIVYWDNASIHAIDRRDGKTIIGFSSGSINIISNTEVLLMVGNNVTGAKSIIQILENKISLQADSIFLNGENVYLGRNSYGPVVVTQGSDINVTSAAKGVFA